MTNTRITDAEIFERRYPVLLREFSLRAGSGGRGKHRGGDGVVRDIEFRIPVQVSILSERRVYHPYGLEGGEDAACGLNIWVRMVEKSDKGSSDSLLLEGSNASIQSNETNSSNQETQYEERRINLGGKNTAAMQAGERIIIHTPGGGGWGNVGERDVGERSEERAGGKRERERNRIDPRAAWKGGSFASREELALQA